MVIIGVDIGTSGIKVIAYNRNGEVLFHESAACAVIRSSPEKIEQDPRVVFELVKNLLQKAFLSLKKEDVKGVCFSAAMHSLIAIDVKGNCLTDAILWGDTRSMEQANQLKKNGIAGILYEETCVPMHPALPLCKIIWLKQEMPALFEKTAVFISIKEYIFYQLFGKYLVDHSIAAATGMQNIHDLQWSETALQTAGITREQLSEIVPAIHTESVLKEEYRRYFGLEKEIPFIIGSSDGCLANIGTGVFDASEIALTIGTSGAVRTTIAKPVFDQPGLFCYPLLKKLYVWGGPVNNGGYVLRWLAENLLGQTLQSEQEYNDFIKEGAAVEPGAGALLFLPYLQGERAPLWDAQARGVFFGLNGLHTRAHLIRAVLEGINYALYSVFEELVKKTDRVETIYVSGGFVRSDVWVQMVADIFNKKVMVTDVADASAIGAACLGFYATGLLEEMNEMATSKHGVVFLPDAARHFVYRKYFDIFCALYPALQKEFTKLHVAGKASLVEGHS